MLAASVAALLFSPMVTQASAGSRAKRPSALPAFNSCASLLSYARRNARRTEGRVGVPTRVGVLGGQALNAPAPAGQGLPSSADGAPPVAAPAPASSSAPSDQQAPPSFSSTNVQEVGVDEPDIIKTDGRRVFVIAGGRLHAFDASADIPRRVGSVALAGSGLPLLLIRGDRALVLTTSYGADTTVTLSEIDVSDPAAMVVRRTMRVDGQLVDARLTGPSVRVVVASSPGFATPRAVARAGVRRYLPLTTLHSRLTRRTLRRSVAPCRAVRHPRAFSGLDLLSLLTFDLDKGLYDIDRDAIMAGAQTVYSSPTSLYVASQRYVPGLRDGDAARAEMRTEIHRFDASTAGKTSYAASGSVTGYVLNQYSMSEFAGALRVASTQEPTWVDGAQSRQSESFVTVLAQRGQALSALGRVDGLGHGERIYAVRFVGEKGYVVTFRQVDPLYTLDLSDKAHPKVLGELKIRGYSAYLHPISDDLLLGVGQDATAEGRTLGTQLSLFDVSNLRRPLRRAHVTIAGAGSAAEFDPHAFLFWKPSRLAVIPLSTFQPSRFEGAIGFSVGSTSLTEAGRITHPVLDAGGSQPVIERTLVIGGRLYSLSYAGLQSNRLDTLGAIALAPFPQPPEVTAQPVP